MQTLAQELWMERMMARADNARLFVSVCWPSPQMWLQMAQRYHSSDEWASPSASTPVARQRGQICGTLDERVTPLLSAKFAPFQTAAKQTINTLLSVGFSILHSTGVRYFSAWHYDFWAAA